MSDLVGVCVCAQTQLEDPAIRWQMALYKDMPNRSEDTSDPEKTVERVLDIAHVLFHLDQVSAEHLAPDTHTHSTFVTSLPLYPMAHSLGG